MLYLFWGLLNIGLFLYFIIICLKATRFIRDKIGILASFIFVFGLMSFIGPTNNNSNNNLPNSNIIKTWNLESNKSLIKNHSNSVHVILEKTMVSQIELSINYGKEKQSMLNIPTIAYSRVNGFVSGINWKPLSISVSRTNNNEKLTYFVEGIVEWKLLGATIYSQLKVYNGNVILNSK